MTAFEPHWPLRHAQLQSALASFKLRNWPRRGHAMARLAAAHTLDCGEDQGQPVRLLGFHSPQPSGAEPRGLVILIHGWEGSHNSAYLYSLACTLYDAGYNVFRLNLRDHGDTHHLNQALFNSARMNEVLGAVRAIGAIDPTRPQFVIGFSLGGNFALRVGLQGPATDLKPDLSIGICPAIDPGATLHALDHGPKLFHRYFIDKWRKTLRLKQAAWPEVYDFSELASLTNFREITARFVERYTEYGSLERYLGEYTLTPDLLRASTAPLAIITAQDDPVVPFNYFKGLEDGEGLRFLAPKHGGHCGFIENFRLRSWAEKKVLELLAAATPGATGSGRPA